MEFYVYIVDRKESSVARDLRNSQICYAGYSCDRHSRSSSGLIGSQASQFVEDSVEDIPCSTSNSIACLTTVECFSSEFETGRHLLSRVTALPCAQSSSLGLVTHGPMIRLLVTNVPSPKQNLGVREPLGQDTLIEDAERLLLLALVSTKNEDGRMRTRIGRRVGRHAAIT